MVGFLFCLNNTTDQRSGSAVSALDVAIVYQFIHFLLCRKVKWEDENTLPERDDITSFCT